MSEHIFLTGGAGFVGTHYARWLRRRGHDVTSYDILPPRRPVEGVRYLTGDVRDASHLERTLRDCTRVIHLAAAHHDMGLAPETYFSVNVDGTDSLCRAMERTGVSWLAFVSSAAVYGGKRTPTGLAPSTPYGQSKLAAEQVIQRWCGSSPAHRALIVRPPVVFGPGNFANLYLLTSQIMRGRFYFVGNAENRKSMVFVGNLLTVIEGVNDSVAAGECRVVNYADKPDLTQAEIVTVIYRALGRKPPRVRVPLRAALAVAGVAELVGALSSRRIGLSRARVLKLNQETVLDVDPMLFQGFGDFVPLPEALAETARWAASSDGAEAEHARLPPVTARLQGDPPRETIGAYGTGD